MGSPWAVDAQNDGAGGQGTIAKLGQYPRFAAKVAGLVPLCIIAIIPPSPGEQLLSYQQPLGFTKITHLFSDTSWL
jgi:hypothetical protein